MRARRITALALAMVAVLGTGGLAACSDDDGGDDDVALEDIGDDSDGDTTTTTSSDDDDSSDTTLGGGDFAEGCAEFGEAFSGLATSIGLGGDVDQSALDDFDDAIAEAPEEIRDDLEVYAQVFREYAEALEEAGVDPSNPGDIDADDAARLGELSEVFSSDEFVEASTAINEFVASNCSAG
jgi:hypothetical protein